MGEPARVLPMRLSTEPDFKTAIAIVKHLARVWAEDEAAHWRAGNGWQARNRNLQVIALEFAVQQLEERREA